MSKRSKLPTIIGRNLQKGMFVTRSWHMSGYDLWIVWLKKDVPSGERFEIGVVDKVDTVLHFCDRGSVERMIRMLKEMLEMWRD